MSKHTPGPWKFSGTAGLETVRTEESRHFVAWPTVTRDGQRMPSDEVEANARLIAAAPEMLAALEVARETIKTWHEIGGPEDTAGSAWRSYQRSPEMVAINDAIAKATGGDE